MAIEIVELNRHVARGDDPTADIELFVRTDDGEQDAAVLDAIASETGSHFDIYGNGVVLAPRRSLQVEWISGSIGNTAAIWNARVSYGTRGATRTSGTDQPTGYSFSFRAGVGTKKIKRNRELVNRAPSTGEPVFQASPWERSVGVKGNEVAGVDVPDDVFEWTETHTKPCATSDAEYGLILRTAIGTTNEAEFRGWQRGEVFIKSITGSRKLGESNVEINFEFAARKNTIEIDGEEEFGHERFTIEGDEENPAVRGWHYLEVRTREQKDETTSKTMVVPDEIYVHRIFEEFDFSLLEIGA